MERCLGALRRLRVDTVYFLGDAVGYLPGENEVLDLLRSSEIFCQKGNHEGMLLGEIPLSPEKDLVYGISQARGRISRENLDFIRQWPDRRVLLSEGINILLVHGSPDNILEGYVYPDSDLSFTGHGPYDVIFMGNTHYPFVSRRQDKLVVNAGSCGLPRDQGDLAAFAVYDCRKRQAEIFRLRFDSDKVVKGFGSNSISAEVIDCLNRSSGAHFGKIIEEDSEEWAK